MATAVGLARDCWQNSVDAFVSPLQAFVLATPDFLSSMPSAGKALDGEGEGEGEGEEAKPPTGSPFLPPFPPTLAIFSGPR